MSRDFCLQMGRSPKFAAWFVFMVTAWACLVPQGWASAEETKPVVPMRTWTNGKGAKLEASAESITGSNVTLKLRDGRTYTYPISTLAPHDRALLRVKAPWDTVFLRGFLTALIVLWSVGGSMFTFGGLRLLIDAWSEGIWWFLGTTLLAPIGIPVFALTFWHESKWPFLSMIGGSIIFKLAPLIIMTLAPGLLG